MNAKVKEIVKGSHLAMFLYMAKLYDKNTGKEIKNIENKIALVSVLIGEPALINLVAEDKPIPLGIIVRLKNKGINIQSHAELAFLQNRLKKMKRPVNTFSSKGGVSASLIVRAPLSEEEIQVFSSVVANIKIDSPYEKT